VLARGLGGKACDPTRTECRDKNHCVVCELFGCTGWARKFRFQVLDADGKPQKCQIKADQKFQLSFTPLRPVTDEEWALLDITLRLIADYGAIGGRTVLKPSDEKSRADEEHHRDYGLIQILREKSPVKAVDRKTLEDYVQPDHWRKVDHGNFAWASLENFWCVKGRHLARQHKKMSNFNKVIGRKEPKTEARNLENGGAEAKWLAGEPGKSKKVFSFKKELEEAERTFGFVKPKIVKYEEIKKRYEEIKKRLKEAWPTLEESQFQTGAEILNNILNKK